MRAKVYQNISVIHELSQFELGKASAKLYEKWNRVRLVNINVYAILHRDIPNGSKYRASFTFIIFLTPTD